MIDVNETVKGWLKGIQIEIGAGKSLQKTELDDVHNGACDRAIRVVQHYIDGRGLFQRIGPEIKP